MNDIKEIASQMTHTCYRCRFSFFHTDANTRKYKFMACQLDKNVLSPDMPTKCKHWKPEEAVTGLINGSLDFSRKKTLLQILEDRQRLGTF